MEKSDQAVADINLVFAVLGGLFALLVDFSAGMRSAPKLYLSEAMWASLLPMLSGLIAAFQLISLRRRGAIKKSLSWILPSLVGSGFSLLFVWSTWIFQPV